MEARVFNERPLDVEEAELLKALKLCQQESGEGRFCCQDFFMQKFGFDRTPLVSVMRNKLLCHDIIPKTTGLPASENPLHSVRVCTALPQP